MKKTFKISLAVTLLLVIISAFIKVNHLSGMFGETIFMLGGIAVIFTISIAIIYFIAKFARS